MRAERTHSLACVCALDSGASCSLAKLDPALQSKQKDRESSESLSGFSHVLSSFETSSGCEPRQKVRACFFYPAVLSQKCSEEKLMGDKLPSMGSHWGEGG